MAMIITGNTTLRELSLELALLGQPSLTITGRRIGERGCCMHHRELGFAFGNGRTEADAIEAAFVELRVKFQQSLKAPAPRSR